MILAVAKRRTRWPEAMRSEPSGVQVRPKKTGAKTGLEGALEDKGREPLPDVENVAPRPHTFNLCRCLYSHQHHQGGIYLRFWGRAGSLK